MIIDMHMHAFPDSIAQKTIEKLTSIAKIPSHTDGSLQGIKTILERENIALGLLLPIATKPGQQKKVNDWAKASQKGNILSFGSVHPDDPQSIEEIHRIKEMGLKGIKLHPDYQDFFVDEQRLFPIYETMQKLKLSVTFHAGFDPLSPDLIHARPEAIARVSDFFPDLTIIAAHMGGYNLYEEVLEHLAGKKNVYFDTSMSYVGCPIETYEKIIKTHGTKRILFGSDCPWSLPSLELSMLDNITLSEDERKDILYNNAKKILGI